MAVLTDRAAAVKNCIAMLADHVFGGTLIEPQEGLVYLQDAEVSVVNGQRVSEAVENSQEKMFTARRIRLGREKLGPIRLSRYVWILHTKGVRY